jgi:hypothetical protein
MGFASKSFDLSSHSLSQDNFDDTQHSRGVPESVTLTTLQEQASDTSFALGASTTLTSLREYTSEASFGSQPVVSQQADPTETILDDLKTLVEAMKADDDLEIIAEVLLGSMDMHESNQGIQLYCLQTMAELFTNAVTESTVLVSKIVRAMNSFTGSLGIQKTGCEVLSALAANSNNCGLLTRTGACKCLSVAVAHHIGDVGLVCNAIAALRMLSVAPEARDELKHLEVNKQIAEAMMCNQGNADIQRDACAVLSNISVDPTQGRVSAVEKDVLDAVVGALETHSADSSVTTSAIFALKNFTYEESNLRSCRKISRVFELLLQLVQDYDSDDAAFLLERLQLSRAEDESMEEQANSSLSSIMNKSSEESHLVADVVDLMEAFKWSSRTAQACIHALASLVGSSESHLESLQQDGPFSRFVDCIELHADDMHIKQEARSLMSLLGGYQSEMLGKRFG